MSLYNKCVNSNTPVIQAQIKLGLASLLVGLCRLPIVSSCQPETDMRQNLVRNIIAYIYAGYMNEITLEQLENNFHMSRFHICREFKKTTGFSVVEYKQNRRIIEAQKMLESTDRDIIEICCDWGFNNLLHINRVFKKITGSTPYKYRKANNKR